MFTRLLCAALPVFVLASSLNAPALARHRATRAHTVASPYPAPVILAAHPGTALDQDARTLNEDDLTDAAKHHDYPVVLVGSAPLSSKKDDEALFVQLQSARLCGSAGCTTSVYLRHNKNWTTVLDSVNGDISVLGTSHLGMRDLQVGRNDRWVWDGSQYQDTLNAPAMPNLR